MVEKEKEKDPAGDVTFAFDGDGSFRIEVDGVKKKLDKKGASALLENVLTALRHDGEPYPCSGDPGTEASDGSYVCPCSVAVLSGNCPRNPYWRCDAEGGMHFRGIPEADYVVEAARRYLASPKTEEDLWKFTGVLDAFDGGGWDVVDAGEFRGESEAADVDVPPETRERKKKIYAWEDLERAKVGAAKTALLSELVKKGALVFKERKVAFVFSPTFCRYLRLDFSRRSHAFTSSVDELEMADEVMRLLGEVALKVVLSRENYKRVVGGDRPRSTTDGTLEKLKADAFVRTETE